MVKAVAVSRKRLRTHQSSDVLGVGLREADPVVFAS
jgi:hypothetical protein